jgi:hypothetical protein
LLLLIAASCADAALPAIKVSVLDASGKDAFKGATDGEGVFTTPNLRPGNYVVQFNSTSLAKKGSHYALVVSAGKKKVVANAISGEMFEGPGVAMRVTVGSGLKIIGQVAPEPAGGFKNGKKMVWIPRQLRSNLPGHWVEEGSAEEVLARTAGSMSVEAFRRRLDTTRDY